MHACSCIALLCATASVSQAFLAPLPNVSTATCLRMSLESGSSKDVIGRDVLLRGALSAGVAAALALTTAVSPADAIGPVKIALTNPTYAEVTCPPNTQVPGQKAGAGLRPVCIKVKADADNPAKKDLENPAIFGRVFDEDGTSVVANNPDGGTDAGQFAMIEGVVPPGKSKIEFQFVAAIGPKEELSKKTLTFPSIKAISYPGAGRYGAITECEMNPLADECDLGDDFSAYRRVSK
eukprot:TRINITY_DN4173_c0_g1_i1.p1 TRINITY_DN4173_c0_g1~~TRINITY_DN4173_c0_g1_i1.p1  ORF type:complete len:237 (-),score=54.14 TRINITY_DN4173_c0_g1_i1:320-1030(-)